MANLHVEPTSLARFQLRPRTKTSFTIGAARRDARNKELSSEVCARSSREWTSSVTASFSSQRKVRNRRNRNPPSSCAVPEINKITRCSIAITDQALLHRQHQTHTCRHIHNTRTFVLMQFSLQSNYHFCLFSLLSLHSNETLYWWNTHRCRQTAVQLTKYAPMIGNTPASTSTARFWYSIESSAVNFATSDAARAFWRKDCIESLQRHLIDCPASCASTEYIYDNSWSFIGRMFDAHHPLAKQFATWNRTLFTENKQKRKKIW